MEHETNIQEEQKLQNTVIINDYTQQREEEQNHDLLFRVPLIQDQRTPEQIAADEAREEHEHFLASKHYRVIRFLDDRVMQLSEELQAKKQTLKALVSPIQKSYRQIKNSIRETELYKNHLLKQHAANLERARTRLNEDPMLTTKRKAASFLTFLKLYPDAVALWKEQNRETLDHSLSFTGEPADLLRDCERMFRADNRRTGIAKERGFLKASVLGEDMEVDLLSDALKKARERDKSEPDKPLPEEEQGVSEEQKKAVEKADIWLLGRATRKDAPMDFVQKVLKSSTREKLFLYHQIETGRLESAGGSDALVSQVDYIPNLSIIKKRLMGAPFHLWNKLRHRGARAMHWEKLDGAYELMRAPEIREEIRSFGSLDSLNRIPGMDLSAVFKAAARCQQAIEKRDNSVFFLKRVRNEEVMDAAKAAFAAVEPVMKELLAHMPKQGEKAFSDTARSGFKESEKMSNLMKFAFTQTASLGGKINQVPLLFQDAMKEAVIASKIHQTDATMAGMDIQNMMTGVNITAGAFTTMTGIMALMGTLKGILPATGAILSGDLDWSSITSTVLGLGKGAVAGGFATSAGITSMIYAPAIGLQSAGLLSDASKWAASIDHMKVGMKAAGATVSGLSLGVDMASGLIQGRNFIHHHIGSRAINTLKEQGKLTGIDADYAKGIVRLDRRNKAKKAIETTASAVGNTVTLTTTLIGAPVGALVGLGINMTTQIATKITTSLLTKWNMKKTVDEFLQLDDLEKIRGMYKDPELLDIERLKNDSSTLNRLKDGLREHMAAELGYSSYKTLYKHVVKNYSGFLFQKLFFHVVDGKPVPYTENTQPKDDPEVEAYRQLVKGLGLRVRYPKDMTGTGRHPSPVMIAAKLMG